MEPRQVPRSRREELAQVRANLERARAENVDLVNGAHEEEAAHASTGAAPYHGSRKSGTGTVGRLVFLRSAAELEYDEQKKHSKRGLKRGCDAANEIAFDPEGDSVREHEKRVKGMRPVPGDAQDTGVDKQVYIEELRDRVSREVQRRVRRSGAKRRAVKESAEMGISEKNRRFNEVAERAYKDDAAPIKADLERGTALPDFTGTGV
ncbi:hypothetical protein FVE85_2809 [Porphyridium purpureum]|uniref:Pre-mRNA-splicing factor SYF2 n=1 Tax=Porphyridium purpureum TaxID=35688 RepID=A0A5J4YTR1_PORPP|nr:hypothetical protein FVE85_2809 [Porphyridium purpureum]|eukprot:POR8752..scf227_4